MKKDLFNSSPQELMHALEQVQGAPVLVVGDLMIDRYIWGSVDRISAEAPVPVIDIKRLENRLGGAGNVAHNLVAIGAAPTVCGIIGDDDEGRELLRLLERHNISHNGVVVDSHRPTSVKTRVIAQRQQMIRIDREMREPISGSQAEAYAMLVDSLLDSHKAIILSDYGKGSVTQTLISKFRQARASKRIHYPERALFVDPHPDNYHIYDQVCVIKPNRKEAELAVGMSIRSGQDAKLAAEKLEKKWNTSLVVLTLGEDGILLCEKGKEIIALPTVAREVFDVSGAGDTVSAVLSAALAAGIPLKVAGELANLAAGVVVSEVGTVAVTREKLKNAIENLN